MTIEHLIYQILRDEVAEFITTKDLAFRLGLKDERELRAKGDDMGVLEKAKAYAYREHRMLIVTNYKGVRMFDDPVKALDWTSKKQKRLRTEARSINKEVLRARHALNQRSQLVMDLA